MASITNYLNDGFNINGYDLDGYDKDGCDRNGFTKDGFFTRKAKIKLTNYNNLVNAANKLSNGEMTLGNYLCSHKTSLDDLIELVKPIAKVNNIDIKKLNILKHEAEKYNKEFDEKEFLNTTSYLVNDGFSNEKIYPTHDDVVKAREYLILISEKVCDYTMKKTIRLYKQGKLDIDAYFDKINNYSKNKKL